MWCARFYKEEHGEYKESDFNLTLPDDLPESNYITIVHNKITNILKEELNITHFRLFVITTPNTEGIPQTRFIEL